MIVVSQTEAEDTKPVALGWRLIQIAFRSLSFLCLVFVLVGAFHSQVAAEKTIEYRLGVRWAEVHCFTDSGGWAGEVRFGGTSPAVIHVEVYDLNEIADLPSGFQTEAFFTSQFKAMYSDKLYRVPNRYSVSGYGAGFMTAARFSWWSFYLNHFWAVAMMLLVNWIASGWKVVQWLRGRVLGDANV